MKKVIAVVAIMLSGCASYTGIVPIGKDTYMVAKQQATGFPGLGNMKAELMVDASKYCSSQGKSLQLVSTNESQPPYVLGNYPRSEINFMCLNEGDPELKRPKLENNP
jgi:hypothetical protein